MIDPILLRSENIENTAQKLKERRNFTLNIQEIISLNESRKENLLIIEKAQADKNALAKEIGRLKAKGENVEQLLQESLSDKFNTEVQIKNLKDVEQRLQTIIDLIPNIPQDIVPLGKDENDNIEICKWGTPRVFDFDVKDHVTLGELKDDIDFETAALIAGSRFAILKRDIARLNRAIIQFMLDEHNKAGYEEMNVPVLVNKESLYGTGQLPKFASDLFFTQLEDEDVEGQTVVSGKQFALIPTSEVPLTNMVAGKILEKHTLPYNWTAFSSCFRSEAGSYGRDTRGLIRMHQFEKVELVIICTAEESNNELEKLTNQAELILKKLELPYRKILLCTGDMGFSSSKTYDLEVWIPSQNTYREISSCSNMFDFQARRMQARTKGKEDKKPSLVHTLNGSGLAVGRTLVAILENYQQADGSIKVPTVLVPYLQGMEYINKV